jgi:ADP-ribose pyrophosphatase
MQPGKQFCAPNSDYASQNFMKKWKHISSKTIHKDRWIHLRADACLLPNGKAIAPFYVLEAKDWVHIVAVDSEGRMLLTRQYRYAADVVSTEFPCGEVDPGEKPLDAAKRELKEETGFEAEDWQLVYVSWANPARQTNKIHCYLAKNLLQTGGQSLDESEDIEFGFAKVAEIKDMIQTGEFTQVLHIASLYAALDQLLKDE